MLSGWEVGRGGSLVSGSAVEGIQTSLVRGELPLRSWSVNA